MKANVEMLLLKLADGARVLRSNEPASGLCLEKRLDPRQSVARQKERWMHVFQVMAVFAPTTALETVTFGGVSRLAPVGMPAIFVDGRFVVSGPVTNGDSAQVSMSSSFPEGHIFYVLEVGTSSPFTLYNQPFAITNSTTIRATAYSSDLSRVAEADPLEVIILPTYTLTATSAGGGTVTLDPAAARYLSNMAVRVTAMPSAGWSFLRWTGDAAGTNRSITVNLTRNKAVEAVFGTVLNTVAQGPGSVVLQPNRPLHPFGSTVRLTAVPQTGHQFMLWGNAASGNTNPLDYAIRSATQAVAALKGQHVRVERVDAGVHGCFRAGRLQAVLVWALKSEAIPHGVRDSLKHRVRKLARRWRFKSASPLWTAIRASPVRRIRRRPIRH